MTPPQYRARVAEIATQLDLGRPHVITLMRGLLARIHLPGRYFDNPLETTRKLLDDAQSADRVWTSGRSCADD